MTTAADLSWWLPIAPTLRWTWARTEDLRQDGAALVHRCWQDAGHLLRRLHSRWACDPRLRRAGEVYRVTRIYLFTEDRQRQFWVGWSRPPRDDDATLINMAETDKVYGPQSNFDVERVRELRWRSMTIMTRGGDNQDRDQDQ